MLSHAAACSQVVYDREVITTEPAKKALKGVLFAFHGCLQSVTQFGFASPACPTCHGEPQPASASPLHQKFPSESSFSAKTWPIPVLKWGMTSGLPCVLLQEAPRSSRALGSVTGARCLRDWARISMRNISVDPSIYAMRLLQPRQRPWRWCTRLYEGVMLLWGCGYPPLALMTSI